MIQLSASATNEVSRLKAKTHSADSKLRISVLSGSCLNFSYSLTFDRDAQPEDHVYQSASISVLVSSKALPYLNGLVLDYSEDLMGGGFRFHNPNAIQSCSCGNSFSISNDG
ncbi:iron-sulfur cluster assembly accessory protein [Phormidium sp. CLA17]|uniref:HesB/IscA family protein n=1 Tax=Leptolyngbya sp. Cla-17 TaxID=2803751 RepID=UPI0014910D6D|nr:iron-sulfur cluster assembly accessory protein [Leptolyngbya sp. Cla-17]MBM0743654.1 iron-sulfur cluster assembly accessory protein [Leptolyngbya sp. Cla-17]